LKVGLKDSKVKELEEDDEVPRKKSEMKNAEIEALTFGGVSNVVVAKEFPPKIKDPCSFSILCMVGQVRIDRALCDLGVSVSPVFHFLEAWFR